MKRIPLLLLSLMLFFACTKEKKYEYEVDPVTVSQNSGDKTTQKTTSEFISIAYADLFGIQIPQTRLVNLSIAYSSFGDQKVIEDRIIRNFVNTWKNAIRQDASISPLTVYYTLMTSDEYRFY